MIARLVLLLALLAGSARAIDLTPRYIDTFSDGVVFHRLYFADEEKKYLVSINRETEVTADSGGALFRFPKFPEITFQLLRSRHSPDDAFEGAPLERYRESAKRMLPIRARNGVIREETANPLPVNNWQSYRIQLSAELDSQIILQTVTFLNLSAHDQVVLVTTAPEKDFPEAAARSFQIIRTWQPMLPGDERPARAN